MGFISLGCPKNTVDTERMLAETVEADLNIVADINEADVLVINTCGFIKPAIEESFEEIENAVKHKKTGSLKKVIVAGCLSERMGDGLIEKFPDIDAVVGLGQRDDIAKIIYSSFEDEAPHTYLEHRCWESSDDRARLLISSPHSTYLRISDGCNHKCTFCTIPQIRGPFRSKPMERIIQEARDLSGAGIKEINIIAQDTGYYGRDMKIKNGLAKVLNEIEEIDTFQWIRLLYLYPTGITDKLIKTIKNSDRIVNYLDMPIQHISDPILKKMKRPDTKEKITDLIKKLKEQIPSITLRTTVIVGFPGETDEQFEELLEFIKWAEFDALGAFEFYPEEGTKAAEMPDQVPEDIKKQRLEELMLAQQKIAFKKNENMIGNKLKCLIDDIDPNGVGIARYFGQAPEIDSICYIENCSSEIGEMANVQVTGYRDYDLVTEEIQD